MDACVASCTPEWAHERMDVCMCLCMCAPGDRVCLYLYVAPTRTLDAIVCDCLHANLSARVSLDTRDHILYIKEDTGRFKTFLSTHFIGAALMAPETHACGPRPVMACGRDMSDDCFGRVVATTGKASALEGTV